MEVCLTDGCHVDHLCDCTDPTDCEKCFGTGVQRIEACENHQPKKCPGKRT